MAGCTEVSFFCCLCTDMGRVKFLSFADNFDPVSNKAKHCSLLKRLCLSGSLRKQFPKLLSRQGTQALLKSLQPKTPQKIQPKVKAMVWNT